MELRCIAAKPEVFVNGAAVREARLQHGDLIELSDLKATFLLCDPPDIEQEQPPLTDRHSSELVAGLEEELRFIDTHAAGTDRIHELLKAAHEAVEACQNSRTLRFLDYVPQTSQGNASQDSQLAGMLMTRLAAQETRLNEICSVMEQLVHQQQIIAAALQCVVERIDNSFGQSNGSNPLRASA